MNGTKRLRSDYQLIREEIRQIAFEDDTLIRLCIYTLGVLVVLLMLKNSYVQQLLQAPELYDRIAFGGMLVVFGAKFSLGLRRELLKIGAGKMFGVISGFALLLTIVEHLPDLG